MYIQKLVPCACQIKTLVDFTENLSRFNLMIFILSVHVWDCGCPITAENSLRFCQLLLFDPALRLTNCFYCQKLAIVFRYMYMLVYTLQFFQSHLKHTVLVINTHPQVPVFSTLQLFITTLRSKC